MQNLKIETLRWVNDHLEMIDQRVLPTEFKYIPANSADEMANCIGDMVVRGAPAIGVAAAYGVALEALKLKHLPSKQFHQEMVIGFDLLAKSRPTAVNLFWALNRMKERLASITGNSSESIACELLALAKEIHEDDIRINKAMGAYGAELLKDGDRVLTHCNAGALATAGHGTALGVIRSAVEVGKKISVIADETRPFLQGARLTAWEMVREQIPVTLITDNMAGFIMAKGGVDAVIVGADRVAANGDVANKVGTYMVAVLAQRHNIPFYVACPLSTIDLGTSSGKEIVIEERAAEEVMGFRDFQWAAQGVKIQNPAFDITPSELVTALITEYGVITNPTLEVIVKLVSSKTPL
jgi:methylthioribose-1-phosphate isomerase